MNKKIRVKMNRFEVFKTITLLFIALLLFLGVFWFGGTLVGYKGLVSDTYFYGKKPMIIVSGSMQPEIETNSLLLLNQTPYEELKLGDIIMFQTNEYGLVIHRIVDEVLDGFITKGDNNEQQDSWVVREKMYKGKVETVYNNVAPVISFLFGDLNNLNIWRILFGMTILALVIVMVILFLCRLYKFIFLYHFIYISSKLGGENVVNEYYKNAKLLVDKEELVSLYNGLNKKRGLLQHLVLRYKIMKFHDLIYRTSYNNKSLNKLYIDIRKDMKT